MIFEGVVEYVDNKRNIVKVRVPQLHGTKNGTIYVPTERINNAYISSTPGVKYTLKVGDVVTIGYYNWDASRPVILGIVTVPREKNNFTDETTRDLTIASDSLLVKSDATLPQKTTIGEITYDEIKHLKGMKENITDALVRVENGVNNAYNLASATAQNLQQNYYTGAVVDSKISTASKLLLDAINSANDSSIEDFINNFIQSFNWYQCHLCDWAKGIDLDQYTCFIAPLNEKGVISGADININGVPLHLAGAESFGEALVKTLKLWVANPKDFDGGKSNAHKKIVEKYQYSVGGGSEADAWCAMAVSALFAYQCDGLSKGIELSFAPGGDKAQFCSNLGVTQLAWSGKRDGRKVGFPAELRKGSKNEIIIPLKELQLGGKYCGSDGKPKIKPGDIGISKYLNDGSKDGVLSHAFYITSEAKYNRYNNKGWYVEAIGGNNSSSKSSTYNNLKNEADYYIESHKLSGIIRPLYNQNPGESVQLPSISSDTKESLLDYPYEQLYLTEYIKVAGQLDPFSNKYPLYAKTTGYMWKPKQYSKPYSNDSNYILVSEAANDLRSSSSSLGSYYLLKADFNKIKNQIKDADIEIFNEVKTLYKDAASYERAEGAEIGKSLTYGNSIYGVNSPLNPAIVDKYK